MRGKTSFIEGEKGSVPTELSETAQWKNKMAEQTARARLSPTATPRPAGSVGSSVRFGPHTCCGRDLHFFQWIMTKYFFASVCIH